MRDSESIAVRHHAEQLKRRMRDEIERLCLDSRAIVERHQREARRLGARVDRIGRFRP